ncbi:hypothetical protein [Nocardioides insulae]|uniref:hypothetical protein n=1 Tax=Nocardioides insulae TaxID=394734 RepID=UPI0004098FD5|nr:hypothetical protein [Nocardioides insulae]
MPAPIPMTATASSSDLILAHGVGGAKDLPLPPELAIVGAVAAMAVSFVVLAFAWRTPRYAGEASGRPAWTWLATIVDSAVFRWSLKAVGLLVLVYLVVAALFGQDLLINPLIGIFYVWWWVGIPFASVLVGPVWRAISPMRTLNDGLTRLIGADPGQGMLTYPARLGYWPAAIGLFLFVWQELVNPDGVSISSVRLWCAVYVAVMLVGGLLFGSTFYRYADPFEVFSELAAKLSVWGRREGRLVVRSPLANLDTVDPGFGLPAVVCVLFGSTAFDSFSESSYWVRFVQGSEWMNRHDWSLTAVGTVTLMAFCVGVGAIFALGTMLTGIDERTRRRDLPRLFAHSMVPIIVGYVVAHYLSLLVETGQQTLIQASDPLSTGANILGTADLKVRYVLSDHPTLLATLKVIAVVTGHVLGVVSSHDRALKLLPAKHQLSGQLSLLIAMIGFTVGGLFLLFSS